MPKLLRVMSPPSAAATFSYPFWMLRPLSLLLMIVGLVVGGLSAVIATDAPNRTAQSVETAPVTLTRSLTPGVWSIYEQAGTGPFGTPFPVTTTVTGPGNRVLTVGIPSTIDTLRIDSRIFAEAANVRIARAGNYVVGIAPLNGTPLRVLLIRVPHPRFPWNALALDGLIVLVAGATLFVQDGRRRRQMTELEVAYAHS